MDKWPVIFPVRGVNRINGKSNLKLFGLKKQQCFVCVFVHLSVTFGWMVRISMQQYLQLFIHTESAKLQAATQNFRNQMLLEKTLKKTKQNKKILLRIITISISISIVVIDTIAVKMTVIFMYESAILPNIRVSAWDQCSVCALNLRSMCNCLRLLPYLGLVYDPCIP